MVIFIPFAVPGDVVDIQITRKKIRMLKGKITTHSYSTNRETPF